MNTEKINGYGAILRFITPVLITVMLFVLGMMREDIKELKVYFANHLSRYNQNCLEVESRLKGIETELKYRR